MDLKLKNRVAIVAGASQGLGKATAQALAREGVRTALCARNTDALRSAADEINRWGAGEAWPVKCDVTQEHEILDLVHTVAAAWGGVDILVNNAGGPPTGLFEDLSPAAWRQAIELNLLSTVHLSRTVVPHMKRGNWGRIVNITSIAAKQPIPGLMLSNATRAGVLGFAKTLSRELAPENITVNSVCPGYTRTGRLIELAEATARRESVDVDLVYRRWEEAIPMKRLGKPEELAALIAFLCSEQAGYITGCAIQVDGGFIQSIF